MDPDPLPVLPDDLITDILLRLPVKSLVRFRSVCKEWNFMFTRSKSFINKHYNRKSNHTRLLVYWYANAAIYGPPYDPRDRNTYTYVSSYRMGGFTLFSDKELVERISDDQEPKLPGTVFAMRGPCKGIYCLQGMGSTLFCLWNPATKRLRPLPPLPKTKNLTFYLMDSDFGFGVLESTNDEDDEFKVVLIRRGAESPCIPKSFLIYSSKYDSWRYRQYNLSNQSKSYFISNQRNRSTFLSGCYYWRIYDRSSRTASILEFNMQSEGFEEIETPDEVRYRVDGELDIYNDDSLALFSFDTYVDHNFLEIWLMKEKNNWTKLSTVILPFRFGCPAGFWEKNNFFVSRDPVDMMLYNIESGNVRTLTVHKFEKALRKLGAKKFDSAGSIYIWPKHHMESLISVKNGHEIQDYDSTQSTMSLEFLDQENWLELED